MNLYEIDQAILDCIDMESGEVIDLEKLEALQMAKDKKVENIACWIKDLKAEAEAIAAEVKELQHRKKVAENKAESLKQYLTGAICGQKLSSAKYSISWRKSKVVVVEDEQKFIEWAETEGFEEFLKYKAPEISKTAIKAAIEDDLCDVPFTHIEEKQNIQIK